MIWKSNIYISEGNFSTSRRFGGTFDFNTNLSSWEFLSEKVISNLGKVTEFGCKKNFRISSSPLKYFTSVIFRTVSTRRHWKLQWNLDFWTIFNHRLPLEFVLQGPTWPRRQFQIYPSKSNFWLVDFLIMIRNPFNSCLTAISKRWATNLGGGSTSNGRDSAGKRLGIKMGNGTKCKTGQIIVRQRGFKYYPGENVN